ncbi:MAG TPA: hypothetical protein VGM51_04120 [Armatimonadota bacterium]|jgi:hypothetical protein
MAYCQADSVKGLIPGVDLTVLGDAAAQSGAISSAIASATSEVDVRCRRTFAPPSEASERHIDGTGGLLLRVPDLVRLDGVTVDGSPIPSATAYPLDGPPYLWIATGARIPEGAGNVSIAGMWGYGPAVPEDIARATACLSAAEILTRIQADRSDGVKTQVTGLAREEFPDCGAFGDTIRNLQTTAGRLLLPYRRWTV